MKIKIFLCLYFFNLSASYCLQQQFKVDSLRVEKLNSDASKFKTSEPRKTISTANVALRLAEKINFGNGMAEAYRVMGTGYAAINEADSAVAKFLIALNLFKRNNNRLGEAMTYNNIGNRYKFYDREKALKLYFKAYSIARKEKFDELLAGCSINIASILTKNEKYGQALFFLNQSYQYFKNTQDTESISMLLASKGFLLTSVKKYVEAEKVLLKAKRISIERNYSSRIGSINLNLADIYISRHEFDKAENVIKESLASFSGSNSKIEQDLLKQYYYLEKTRKNDSKALKFLENVYRQDSLQIRELVSKKHTLHQEQFDFIEKQKETEILLERQKRNKVIIISTVIVLLLSFLVIALLVVQSRKKAKTFKKMQELNEEISLQKEELNKVNQNLESIIEERTQDLQVKNLKLSQYSSHLSHEIRSPISTIKGLLILDDEDLIDDQELIGEVRRCVDEIDNKLLNINQMLHNPQYKAFLLPENKNGGIIKPPSNPPNDKDNT